MSSEEGSDLQNRSESSEKTVTNLIESSSDEGIRNRGSPEKKGKKINLDDSSSDEEVNDADRIVLSSKSLSDQDDEV